MRLYRRLLRQYRPETFGVTRRDLLRQTGVSGFTLISGRAAAEGQRPRARHGGRVVIVGAGFAGLACGYELK
jgi:NADPH-dependent 2,4-dienoyl-CoA reductase/sulfur reductase-like enzyme